VTILPFSERKKYFRNWLCSLSDGRIFGDTFAVRLDGKKCNSLSAKVLTFGLKSVRAPYPLI
jgi:hypothetical protein